MTISIFLVSLLGSMALGMPIAFALLVCGAALMLTQGIFDPTIFSQKIVEGTDSFPLLAIPFFLLSGELMNAGGISKRIVNFAMAWVGHIRGGLGYVAIMASVFMAAMSGAAAADAAALGSLLIPMMRKAGYNVNTAGGLLAAGSVIAPVIPPSIGLIVFGVIANVSIGKLFLAGIFPGILMGVSLAIAWALAVRKDKIETLPPMDFKERVRVSVDGVWALFTPFGIIGGLKLGIVTPTEAGVFACVYSFFIGKFVYGDLKWNAVFPMLISAAKTTAVVVFLIATAMISGWLIAVSDIPDEVSNLLAPFVNSPILLMFVIQALVVVIGTALDFAPTVLILTPVLMPVVQQAGIDPVYFGVLFILNNAIGLITPPVGIVLNVICGVAKVKMDDLIKGLWPFMLAEIVALFLMVMFPSLVLVPLKWLL